jgi:hypothetical protein
MVALSMVSLGAATLSTTSAFLAPSEMRLDCASQPSMSKRIHPVSMMLGNKEDPTDVMARVDAMMTRYNSMHTVETFDTESIYFAIKKLQSGPAYTVPARYTPQREKTMSLPTVLEETVVHRVIEMLKSIHKETAKIEGSKQAEVRAELTKPKGASVAAPTKRWTAPSGYVPGGSPAKTWQPSGGYEPKRDRPATSAPASSLSSAPATTAKMSSGMYRE